MLEQARQALLDLKDQQVAPQARKVQWEALAQQEWACPALQVPQAQHQLCPEQQAPPVPHQLRLVQRALQD